MKSFKFVCIFSGIAFFGYQCNNYGSDPLQTQAVTATTPTCFNCHGENTVTGNKVQWAQAGWGESVHANGIQAQIFASYWSGAANVWYVAGYEWHGSDAFYSNGGGCQICHTKEGFLKKINGDYGTVNWTTTSAFSVAIAADSIANPTRLTCFTCHAPHERANFTLNVDPTTVVTTQTGAVYNKTKGSLCASCHQIRLSGYATANAYILSQVVAGSIKTTSSTWGPHHGPQTDLLMGKGGAEYTAKVYTNATHTTNPDANCVNCHMADDFANQDPLVRYSLSPAVGGHSMAVSGIVHGVPAANKAGCTYSTCHLGQTLTGKAFGGSGAIAANGYLAKDKAYIDKTGGSGTTSVTHFAQINGLMKLLADPAASCTGLLQTTFNTITAGSVKWTLMPDGVAYPTTTALNAPTCIHNGFTVNMAANAGATDISNETRFAKAVWNFKLIIEDKSLGLHNSVYALELLYDSCTDLKAYTGGAQDCTLGATYTRP